MKTNFQLIILSLAMIFQFETIEAQSVDSIPLYEGKIPFNLPTIELNESSSINENGHYLVTNVSEPELFVYLPSPDKATGASVIICPGGGYWVLAIRHEGHDFAKWFQERGIAAFVLKYRLPEPQIVSSREVPLLDAQRALELVRSNAPIWHINPDKVGIMGFSAGGHLAAWTSTQPISSTRPNFTILIYPVIQMSGPNAHSGSRDRILGNDPSEQEAEAHDPVVNVNDETPPAFLVHAADDPAVPIRNSINYYQKLLEHHVPASLFTIPFGGHGFGMNAAGVSWLPALEAWLQWMHYMP
ncbi:MAG: alpha/beta hydrolase [Lewinellaceae bacterium]|nr:alpha/beta hydrolase [Lewinellaceae bacterium]